MKFTDLHSVLQVFLLNRISDDFFYEQNVAIGDHLHVFEDSPPWKFQNNDLLMLKIEAIENYFDSYQNGFSIHASNELPFMLNSETVFEFGGAKHIEVLITPVVVRSEDSLKNLDYADRYCYFENERHLRFFNLYTKRNCEIDCYANFTHKTCNCTPFDVPRAASTRICSVFDFFCMLKLRESFEDPGEGGQLKDCECLTTCNSVSYNVEIRDTKIHPNL